MIQLQWIHGISFGLEYTEQDPFGFIVLLDLGIFRIVWYKDLEQVDD